MQRGFGEEMGKGIALGELLAFVGLLPFPLLGEGVGATSNHSLVKGASSVPTGELQNVFLAVGTHRRLLLDEPLQRLRLTEVKG